jgi:ectoine hydroxylase-related dioxygenase (phytanoyl-CoA dioxygenase family)
VTDLSTQFWRDGAVCVRGAFDAGMVALAAEAIDANLGDLSPHAKRASSADDGAFVEDFCSWQRIDALERFVRESPAGAIAAEIMGSRTVRLYHDHVLVKEPGTSQRTPWHQDLPYYNVDGRLNVSMWFPVDPVPAESTLQFVVGSHRGPWYMPRTFLDGQAKWFPPGSLAELPDIDAEPEQHPVVGWELEPGDAVFFHMLTLHAAGGMRAGRRRVLSVRFLGDDMVHAPRPWTTSPPFPGLDAELPAGATMDHPLFPVIWRSPATQAAGSRASAGASSLAPEDTP